MASTPRTPAPDRPPPPVPVPAPPPPLETPSSPPGEGRYHTPPPVPAPPPPLETPPSPSPPGEDYHTPAPSLGDASPREEASYSLPSDGREGAGAPAKSPQLSPMRLASPSLPPPPSAPTGQNAQEGASAMATAAAPARPQLRLTSLVHSPSQASLATKSPSPSPSLTPAPAATSNNRSGQSTPRRAEARRTPLSPAAVPARFDPVEEAMTSPLRPGNGEARGGGGERGRRAARRGGRGRGRGAQGAVGHAAGGHGAAQPRRILSHRQRPHVRMGRRLLRPTRAVQLRRRSERDRLRLLDRAIIRRNSPADLTRVNIPEHVELLLQPVPGPGPGVSPHVGVVGGRVAQRPVGVEVRDGRIQQEDQQRAVAVLHWLPHARPERAHLHG